MGIGEEIKLKSIFEYDDYREYLRDTLRQRKSKNKNFSMRNFARLAGFQAHSFVVRILQGKKDLSMEGIERVGAALKLNKEETSFFKSLVQFNQSKNSEDRGAYATEILNHRSYRKIHPLSSSQFKFLGTWYYVVIRELVSLPGFIEDYEIISRQVQPSISSAQAKRAVDDLIDMGLLCRDENGTLMQVQSLISTTNQVTSSAVAQYHRDMLRLASESIDRTAREHRELAAQTVGVSKQTVSKIIELVRELRVKTMELVSQDQNPDAVYQLNFQLFPVSALPEKEPE